MRRTLSLYAMQKYRILSFRLDGARLTTGPCRCQSKTQNAYIEEPKISRRGYAHPGIMASFPCHIIRWPLMPLISIQLCSRVGKEDPRIVSHDDVGIGRVNTKQSHKGSESSG